MNWRCITDYCKDWPPAIRLADSLGRGRGRLRFLDSLHTARSPRKPDLTHWHKQELAAIWIGHATVLVRVGGMTILTDPVFSNRVGIGLGIATGGPHRIFAPALRLHELPPIDLILVSHAHFDHLDRPTLDRMARHTPIVTSAHTADLVRDLGFNRVTEMRWGESLNVASVRLTAQKVRHWGARALHDLHRGFNAYMIEGAGRRVLYGGDSAYGDHFKDIGKADLAILGIGGYNPYLTSHATPEQAWEMANHANADHVLPVHHSTFRLSHEPRHEPLERLLGAAGGHEQRVVVREVGGQWGL